MTANDFAGLAATFFSNSRTAASLVMASSRLFALSGYTPPKNSSRLESHLFLVYRFFTWTTFALSLHGCVISTVATMGILHGKFDHVAESATEFLLREFEYEFVCINWSILVSLLLIIVMVTLRILLEFHLLSDPKRRNTAKFVVLTAVSLGAHFLSYINSQLCCWSNLFDMTIRMLQLLSARALKEFSFMETTSVLAACGSVYYGLGSAHGYLSNLDHEEENPPPEEEKRKAE